MNTSTAALSAVFSNLAKASEKQQRYEAMETFKKLSEAFLLPERAEGVTIDSLKSEIIDDIQTRYPELQKQAEKTGDRGMQRALKWGEKVTTLQKSLIDRYLLKGDELMKENELFVCEACGFIFLGKAAPEICPVCKAPKKRFTKIS